MIDISNHNPVAIYPGSKEFKVNSLLDIEKNGVQSSWLEIDCHYGTHIDSPSHFIKNGLTIDKFPSELMKSECQVISCDEVTLDFLESIEINSNVLFFKFNNANLNKKFDKDYKAISLEVSKKLIDIGINIIGTNYLSIEEYKGNGDVHRELLSNGVWIIESLNLINIEDGIYEYFCFPLKIKVEASPVRVYLKKIN